MTVIGSDTERCEILVPGAENATLSLSWGVATDTGHKRAHNEDSVIAARTIFAVADGMGGHAAGDVASDAVVTRLAECAEQGFTDAESVMKALSDATDDISHTIDEQELGVGTTATGVAMTLHGGYPYWVVFNVGDSRVYLYEHNVLTQITVDHSVVQELVAAGLITAVDAERHPDSNVVTRAVGFNTAPMPDFWLIPVTSHSRILVCSDGLTKELSELQLRSHLAAGLSSAATVHALIEDALAEGGRDNVTAIVVDVHDSAHDGGTGVLECENTEPSV